MSFDKEAFDFMRGSFTAFNTGLPIWSNTSQEKKAFAFLKKICILPNIKV